MGSELRVVKADTEDSRELERDGWVIVARSWGAQLRAVDCDLPRLRVLASRASFVGRVRVLTPRDAAAVLALDAATVGDYPGSVATAHAALTVAGATVSPARRGYGVEESEGGLAAVTFVDVELARAEVDFTAVAAGRRRLGLATAVKATSVLDLLDQGVEYFRTGGSSDNVAILAANSALGFVIDEQWLTFASPHGHT